MCVHTRVRAPHRITSEEEGGDKGPGDCTYNPPCYLFEGDIAGEDIGQGQLGDCWLMTALVSTCAWGCRCADVLTDLS